MFIFDDDDDVRQQCLYFDDDDDDVRQQCLYLMMMIMISDSNVYI